jgi:hypothetical protein
LKGFSQMNSLFWYWLIALGAVLTPRRIAGADEELMIWKLALSGMEKTLQG